MAYSHCTGAGLGQVQGTGLGMGPKVLYPNVHTGLRQGQKSDALASIVPVTFPVPVPSRSRAMWITHKWWKY